MSIKRTILIALLFAVMLAGYLWDQRRLSEARTRDEAASRLIAADTTGIAAINIERATGDRLRLERNGSTWLLADPVRARADLAGVDAMLNQLASARRKDAFDVAAGGLEPYGLADPAVKLQIEAGDADPTIILLGAQTPDGGSHYARIEGRDQVFVLPAVLYGQLDRPAETLRDRRLVPADLNQTTAFAIEHEGERLAAAKDAAGEWNLLQPEPVPADSTSIEQLLQDLNGGKATQLLDNTPLDEAALGLDTPAWRGRFTVDLGDTTRSLELLIGDELTSPATGRYARFTGDDHAMVLDATLFESITPTADDLRNKMLFSLTAADVGSIMIQVGETPLLLARDPSSERWTLPGESETAVDQARVARTLGQMVALKANRFLAEDATPADDLIGLAPPKLTLRLADRAGATTETLVTGVRNEDFVYARRVETGELVGIDWTQPGNFFLGRDDFLARNLFDFDINVIEHISIGGEDLPVVTLVRQPGGAWLAGERQLDPVRVSAMLYSLTSLEWQRRLEPALPTDRALIDQHQLVKPLRWVELRDREGELLARLGLGGEDDTLSYVVTGTDRYYAIDRGRLTGLGISLDELAA